MTTRLGPFGYSKTDLSPRTAALNVTQADQTLSASAAVAIVAAALITQAPDTLSASASGSIHAALNITQQSNFLSASASTGGVTAALNVTQDNNTLFANAGPPPENARVDFIIGGEWQGLDALMERRRLLT